MGIFRGTGGTGDSTTDTTVNTVTQKAAEAAASATAAASSATQAANSAASINANIVNDTTPQLGGELDGQTNKITNIGDPTSAQDAATKTYVDSQVQSKDALSELSGDSDDITEGSTNLFLTTTERTKLSGIEASATADQTAAEIRTLVESASDSNVFTDADHSKLDGIETSATADQTDAEIKTAYENNSDTNAFTDAEKTKLSGIETGATADQTASEILTAIKTVDGSGSGLDADLLDGNEASAFATSAQGSTADSALQNVSEDTTPQLGGDLDANGKNIKLGDFSNAPTANQLSFGASDDFKFNYNGSLNIASIISGGDLRLESGSTGSQSVTIETSSETMAEFNPNSSVDLYYNNSKKFETTSSGVDITGTVVADGLTVDGSTNAVTLQSSSQNVRYKITDGTVEGRLGVDGGVDVYSGSVSAHPYRLRSNDTKRIEIASNGDISFYEDTGTTAKLTWDASDEDLDFKDSVRAVFGDGSDLTIEHNGTNSQIKNNTGVLQVLQFVDDGDIVLSSDDGSGGTTNYFRADGSTGEAILYHYGSGKLSTKSTGVDVTGTVVADALTVKNNGVTSVLLGETSTGDSTIVEIGKGFDATSAIEWHRSSAIDFKIQVNTNENAILSYNYADLGFASLNFTRGSTETKVFRATVDGDVVFYDDAGTSQDFYWDASTSRLGIGITTPLADLHVSNASGSELRIDTYGGANADSVLNFRENNVDRAKLYWDGADNDLYLETTIGDIGLMPAGNVGIGTTSPDTELDVEGTVRATTGSEYTELKYYGVEFDRSTSYVRPDTDGTKDLFIGASSVNKAWRDLVLDADRAVVFNANASEAMRIDSSGNLLVGKTATGESTDGVELRSSGFSTFTRNNNNVMVVNRRTSDGDIVKFKKDGTTVGSILSKGSGTNLAIVLRTEDNTDGCGIIGSGVGNGRILPADGNGDGIDNHIDLGTPNTRWQDLYLSGGVYLGGTGSANLLDDYEEGTFTPTFGGSTTDPSGVTYDGQTGQYTKVGRIVHIAIRLGTDAITSVGSGNLRIRGLPFNAAYGLGVGTPVAYSFNGTLTNYEMLLGTNYFDFYRSSYAQTSILGTGTNANRLWVYFSYQTA